MLPLLVLPVGRPHREVMPQVGLGRAWTWALRVGAFVLSLKCGCPILFLACHLLDSRYKVGKGAMSALGGVVNQMRGCARVYKHKVQRWAIDTLRVGARCQHNALKEGICT